METPLLLITSFTLGYAAAVYTRPLVKTCLNRVEAEAARLKAQANALLAKSKAAGGQ